MPLGEVIFFSPRGILVAKNAITTAMIPPKRKVRGKLVACAMKLIEIELRSVPRYPKFPPGGYAVGGADLGSVTGDDVGERD